MTFWSWTSISSSLLIKVFLYFQFWDARDERHRCNLKGSSSSRGLNHPANSIFCNLRFCHPWKIKSLEDQWESVSHPSRAQARCDPFGIILIWSNVRVELRSEREHATYRQTPSQFLKKILLRHYESVAARYHSSGNGTFKLTSMLPKFPGIFDPFDHWDCTNQPKFAKKIKLSLKRANNLLNLREWRRYQFHESCGAAFFHNLSNPSKIDQHMEYSW